MDPKTGPKTITITLTSRAEALLDTLVVLHDQRRADEQAQVEADKAERRKAAEEGRTFHGHPCPMRVEMPAKTREEIAADLFERGAAVTSITSRARPSCPPAFTNSISSARCTPSRSTEPAPASG